MPFYNNTLKWNIPDRDAAAAAAALLSLMFPPLERCSGNVQPDRHVTAVLWEREQSRAHLILLLPLLPLQWVCCTGLKHDIPPSASPQVYQHTSQRILYTRTALNTPDSCGTDVAYSEIWSDVFASSAIRGDRWRYMANFTLIWHVAAHPYKRPQHTLARHKGRRRRKTRILSLLGRSNPVLYSFRWGDNI